MKPLGRQPRLARRDLLSASGLAGLAVLCPSAQRAQTAERATPANTGRWTPPEPPLQPIGEAKGLFPGRVVWIHDPKVARWDGNTASGAWYEDRFTDPALAAPMLSRTLRCLTGAKTDAEAWTALFRHFNLTSRRGDRGYQPGEKVAVKLNLNCAKRQADPAAGFYNTPQLTLALFRQLVHQAGVRPCDIVVYDASRLAPDPIFNPAHAEFPEIRFEDRDGGNGRFRAEPDKRTPLFFGDPTTLDHGKTYLPACATSANYLINAAVWKGHSLAGVTLCAKNHFGSVYRENTGPKDPHKGWNPSNLHGGILVRSRSMGTYNPLVDLMGHKDLGGKTILYLVDAIYATPHQSVLPQKWQSSPFDNHWTGSVFASQDPVAIESVAVDFFGVEKAIANMVGTVDNYLHEAALAHRPPSGVRYDPEADGTPLESLGVHEHWNNPAEKQYSRNLGKGHGIELVKAQS